MLLVKEVFVLPLVTVGCVHGVWLYGKHLVGWQMAQGGVEVDCSEAGVGFPFLPTTCGCGLASDVCLCFGQLCAAQKSEAGYIQHYISTISNH